MNNNTTMILPSRLGTAFGASVAFIFIFFGIVGDTIIIVSILMSKKLRNNLVNLFIVSLQLNDLFNIGFNQFFVGLAYAFMKWTGPQLICHVLVYSSIISTGTLLWHHALIAIHRYLVVVCNQNNSYLGLRPNVYLVLSLILSRLIPTLVCIPSFLSPMIAYSESSFRCMLASDKSRFQNSLIVLVNMLIPCLIVLFCFVRIYVRVRRVSKNLSRNVTGQQQQQQQHHSQPRAASLAGTHFQLKKDAHLSLRREYKITKMFAFIFIVFLFGYLPYGLVRIFDQSNSLHPDFYVLLTVLFIISISVSPIIYGLINTQIRKRSLILIQILFTCKKPIDNNGNDTNRPKQTQMLLDKNLTKMETHMDVSRNDLNREQQTKNL